MSVTLTSNQSYALATALVDEAIVPRTVLSIWKGRVPAPVPVPPSMAEIIAAVAERTGFSAAEIKSGSVERSVSAARHEAMRACRCVVDASGRHVYSYARIARAFSCVDHTTVLKACRKAVHGTKITHEYRGDVPVDRLQSRLICSDPALGDWA